MWYFPENSRGIGTATDPFHKTAETAPAGQADYCTYVELYGKYFDASAPVDEQSFITTYRIYLGANNKADFNLLRNHAYTVNVTLRGKNEVDMRVESVLKPANCYMVSEPSTEYTFNATIMGNGCFTPYYEGSGENAPAIVPSRLSPDDAMLVWETGAAGDVIEPGSVKLSADRKFISFRTSAAIGGNAVIAAKQNGDIIWSWHIWSTEYDPETSYDTYVTQTIDNASYNSLPSREIRMMKVNLGATSLTSTPGDINCYGLYYQWGRKDPFVGAKALTGTESKAFGNLTAPTTNYSGYDWKLYKLPTNFTSDDAIVYAVGLPTYFISAISTDWMPLKRSNLWGNPNETAKMPNMDQGSKSIYDPCPAGWRVPPSDTWTMFTSSGIKVSSAADINADGWNYGYNFYCGGWGVGNTAYYPAAGYRKGTGTVIGQLVLDSGDYWSSSAYSKQNQYACSLMFRSGNVNPLYSGMDVFRINGRTVRCAREE